MRWLWLCAQLTNAIISLCIIGSVYGSIALSSVCVQISNGGHAVDGPSHALGLSGGQSHLAVDARRSATSGWSQPRVAEATTCSSGHAQAEAASGSATSGRWKLHAAPLHAAEATQSAALPACGSHRMPTTASQRPAHRTRAQAGIAHAAATR
ncbi:hypothetical protein GW17_00057797 [Ensete ventricosum]|nr:hypothetical protein GW17_00057797 [Ensete ventricosum]RZS20083.1 hypothetical protein BHM03_00052561 [Ensete ventricosum]